MDNTNFQTIHQMGNAISNVVRQATGRDAVQNIDMDYVTVAQRKKLVEETVTGSIVSFVTNITNPLKKLVCNISPVQDLHGYESSWPAGGGKNILSPLTSETKNEVSIAVASDGTITVNGTATENTYFDGVASDVIPNNTTFYLYAFNPVASTNSNNMSIFIITDSGNLQVNLNSVNATSSNSFSTGDKQISKWRLKVPAGVAYTNFILKPMFQIGGTAPTAYAPYSNICPISGWTGCNVSRTGVNVWDEEWELGSYNTTTGAKSTDLQRIRSKNMIPVTPSTGYYFRFPYSVATYGYYLFQYDSNGQYIEGSQKTASLVTLTSQTHYITVCTQPTYGTTYNNDISINYPATDTVYHAYTGTTYPITFPSEAGTVYGGTLTVNKDGTGTLVVDRASYTFNGTEGWTKLTTYNYFQTNTVVPDAINANSSEDMFISNKYPYGSITNGTSTIGACLIWQRIRVRLEDMSISEDDFKASLASVPMQAVLKLATPVTYQLSTPIINTLLGENNIWADTGNITVTYKNYEEVI